MATIPTAGYISDNARTQAQVQTALEDIVASLRQLPGAAQTELYYAISSGSITPAGSGGIILVDTEGAAATDDLTNVVTTNYPDGSMIVLRNSNLARVVTAKHLAGGAGQMNLDRDVDYVMDDEQKWILLQRRSADWYEVFRGPNRMVSLDIAKTATFAVQKEDLGKVFSCTGTFTVSLSAASTVGSGFIVTIRNDGTGVITVDGNSSELVNKSTTIRVSPGASAMLVCDATQWHVIGSAGPQPTESPIINGAMDIWQRGTAFAAAAHQTYTADRWRWVQSGSGVVTVNRSTSVPSVAQAGVALTYSLEVDVTTADASIAAGDYYGIQTVLEGGTWRHFAQRDVTISFWAYSTKTGTHCLAVTNSGADRSYIGTYTINTTNTWEYKTVTVPASPSAGTWNYTTGVGANIYFMMAVGSTYQTTAGAWQTGGFFGSSAQVNCLDSTANFFRVTAVKMELGLFASDHTFTPPELEQLRCQRYYQKSFQYHTTPAQNLGTETGEVRFGSPVGASTAFSHITAFFAVPMRIAPSIVLYNPNAANAQIRNQTLGTDCTGSGTANVTEKSFVLSGTTPASTATTNTLAVHWTASAEF